MKQEEFCRSRGVGRSTLSRYLKRKEQTRRTKAARSRLVPVEVVSKPQRADEDSGLLLIASSGHRVEVRRGFDEATFRQLLDVLERR